nr:hypothetical protein [Halocatena marina]
MERSVPNDRIDVQIDDHIMGNSTSGVHGIPEATSDSGLEQPGLVFGALSAAAVLDILNGHSDVMTISNIVQTVTSFSVS